MDNHLLDIALDWGRRSFGEQMNHPGTRALRVLEEAAELAQACGVPAETAKQCVNVVYDRPVGDVTQEVGGVLMTIFMFVRSLGFLYSGTDPIHYFVAELRRVLGKSPKHFTDRNQEKINLGLQVEKPAGMWCPFCKKPHVGGDACMGHYP